MSAIKKPAKGSRAAIIFGIGLLLLAVDLISWNALVFTRSDRLFRQFITSPMPDSVAGLSVDGQIGLAGGSVVVCFSISPVDFDEVLASREFTQLELNPPLNQEIQRLWPRPRFPGPYEYYEVREDSGINIYRLIVDDRHTNVVFYYVRI